MERKKSRWWVMAAGCIAVLFGLGAFYGYLVNERLEKEGVTTRAVVTKVYSREESRPSAGYRGWRRPRKVTVYLLDYRFRVDGETFEAQIRRTKNLMTARPGDSIVVRYLPNNPSVNRPERNETGDFYITRPRRGRPRRR